MKIIEIVEATRMNPNARMSKLLETKNYLPFSEKIDLVSRIVDKCTIDNNGFIQINEIDQYIHFTIESIKAYTNIEFNEDYIADYDLLCSSGLLGVVIDTFDGEYKMILNMVEMQKRYVLEQNKVEFQVAKVANALVGAIDQFGAAMSGKVDDLDKLVTPENIQMFKEFVGKIK